MLIIAYAMNAAPIAEKPCEFTPTPRTVSMPMVSSDAITGTRSNEPAAMIQNLRLLF